MILCPLIAGFAYLIKKQELSNIYRGKKVTKNKRSFKEAYYLPSTAWAKQNGATSETMEGTKHHVVVDEAVAVIVNEHDGVGAQEKTISGARNCRD